MDFGAEDKRTVFTPDRVTVQTADGSPVEARDDPESSFAGQQADTPWDDVHVAYFSGEALWTYLSIPFLYTRPDFAVEEIAPIRVDGETWRRLAVVFPDSVRSHTRRRDLLLRARRAAAPSRLHRRHSRRGHRAQLRLRVPRGRRHRRPHPATRLRVRGRLPAGARAAARRDRLRRHRVPSRGVDGMTGPRTTTRNSVSQLAAHTYLSPTKPIPSAVPGWDGQATWPATTATLIASEDDALLVDALMTTAESRALGDWFDGLARWPSTIYVTHGHADHFFGATPLLARRPQLSLVALPGAVPVAAAQVGAGLLSFWRSVFPDQLSDEPRPPAGPGRGRGAARRSCPGRRRRPWGRRALERGARPGARPRRRR